MDKDRHLQGEFQISFSPLRRVLSTRAELEGSDHKKMVRRIAIVWSIVFLLNFVLPLIAALFVAPNTGRAGMFCAVLALFYCGVLMCRQRPHFMERVNAGSFVIGLTQIFPVAQSCIIFLSLDVGERLGFVVIDDGVEITTQLGGLIFMAIFGCLLVGLSIIVGHLLAWWLGGNESSDRV